MTRYSFLIKNDEDITVYTSKIKIYDWVEDDVLNIRECLNRLNETNERLNGANLDLEVYKTNSNFDKFKLINKIKSLKKERDDAKKSLHNSIMAFDKLAKKNEELKKRNDLVVKQYNALNHVDKNKINNLKEEIKKLKTKNKRAGKLIAKLKLLGNDSDEYIKTLKREIFDLKQYMRKENEFEKRVFNCHLKRATKEKDEEIKKLKEDLKKANKFKFKLLEENDNRKRIIRKLEKLNTELWEEKRELKETIIRDTNYTLSMCKHGNEQNAKISKLEKEIKQLNEENYRLKKKITSLKDWIKLFMQYNI